MKLTPFKPFMHSPNVRIPLLALSLALLGAATNPADAASIAGATDEPSNPDFLQGDPLTLGSGADEEITLPGFDIRESAPSLTEAGEIRPAATFRVKMKGAFGTSKKLSLDPGGLAIATGSEPHSAKRRVGSNAVPANENRGGLSGNTVTAAPATNLGGAPNVAIPEPGTLVIGFLLLGVCANGTRRRARRVVGNRR